VAATTVNATGNITVGGTVDGRDVAADGTKLDTVATNSNNYSHPNHSGEVTSTSDGATVIADNIVDEANLKVSNSPTNGYALTAQSGNSGGLTWAEITDTNTTYSAGSGLGLSGTTFSHSDTSSQGSVNNSGSNFIQDITVDTYGHITGITSASAGGTPTPNTQTFTSSGTWSKPSGNYTYVVVDLMGGGGGGGGGGDNANNAAGHGGGGGGAAGNRNIIVIPYSEVPSSVSVTVGIGGGYGNGGNNSGGSSGATGGTSKFGGILESFGGVGGYSPPDGQGSNDAAVNTANSTAGLIVGASGGAAGRVSWSTPPGYPGDRGYASAGGGGGGGGVYNTSGGTSGGGAGGASGNGSTTTAGGSSTTSNGGNGSNGSSGYALYGKLGGGGGGGNRNTSGQGGIGGSGGAPSGGGGGGGGGVVGGDRGGNGGRGECRVYTI
jgi:hypothetical protein